MKKKYIETNNYETFFQAMNKEEGIMCEWSTTGEPCEIVEMRLRPERAHLLQCFITVETKLTGKTLRDLRPENIRLYRQEFEDGDLVRREDGKLCIYYKEADESHYWHAVYDEDIDCLTVRNELGGPKHDVKPGDCLCTEEEKERLTFALTKHGFFFDPEEKKITERVYSYKSLISENRGLFDKFIKSYKNIKDWKELVKPLSEMDEGIIKMKGHAKLPYSISSKRGELTTVHDVASCIFTYEKRIEELTQLCDEIYEKLKAERE